MSSDETAAACRVGTGRCGSRMMTRLPHGRASPGYAPGAFHAPHVITDHAQEFLDGVRAARKPWPGRAIRPRRTVILPRPR